MYVQSNHFQAVTVGDGKTGLFNNAKLDRLQAAVG